MKYINSYLGVAFHPPTQYTTVENLFVLQVAQQFPLTFSACMSDFWVVSDGKFQTVAMYWKLSAGRHSTRDKLTFLYQCIIDPCQNWFHYSPTGLAQTGWSKAHQHIANRYIQLLPNPEYTKSYQSRLMFLYITNCAQKGRCVSYYTVIRPNSLNCSCHTVTCK